MMPNQDSPLSLGFIGCGTVTSRGHLPALRSLSSARVAAVSDLDQARLRQIADRHGVEVELQVMDVGGNDHASRSDLIAHLLGGQVTLALRDALHLWRNRSQARVFELRNGREVPRMHDASRDTARR